MIFNRTYGRMALFGTPVLAVLSAWTPLEHAKADETAPQACQPVVGTYLTTITDIEGVFMSRGLITFSGDGNFFVSDSRQGGLPGVFEPFSSGQGAWKCVDGQSDQVNVRATALTFTLPSAQRRRSIGRVDYQGALDPEAHAISGKISLKFANEGDLEGAAPIAAPGPLFEEFSFSGKRVVP